MTDLTALPARYPGLGAPLDLEPYLLNGVRARTPGSCHAFVGANQVTYSLWVAPTSQTPLDATTFVRLPEGLRPLALDQATALHGDSTSAVVVFQTSGFIHLDSARGRYLREGGCLKVLLTTARAVS